MWLLADLADDFIDPEQLASFPLGFFTHKLDRAVHNVVEFLQVVQPHGAILLVEKLRPKPHPGHQRTQIVPCCRNQSHPAFGGVLQPHCHGVKRSRGRLQFGRSTLRQSRNTAVRVDRCRYAFQNRKMARDAVRKP